MKLLGLKCKQLSVIANWVKDSDDRFVRPSESLNQYGGFSSLSKFSGNQKMVKLEKDGNQDHKLNAFLSESKVSEGAVLGAREMGLDLSPIEKQGV